MASRMTGDDWKHFAFGRPRTAKLATVRADGAPHVAPVWVALDGDETPPFSFVLVEGEARISEDVDALLAWSTIIGGRYMGNDRAEEFGRRNAVPGELLVHVRPTRFVGHRNVSE
jgi:hypothetical protein